MSGISCIFNLDKKEVETNQLKAMINAASYLGPDGEDSWSNKYVGLNHQSLKTTPQSINEVQPYYLKSANIVVTADARLDSNRQTVHYLYSNGYLNSLTPTDVELIAASYLCWGENHARYLMGDYSYIIWDGRKEKLLCVRDPFGARPLFYNYKRPRSFIAATSIAQMFVNKSIPKIVNQHAIAYRFTLQPHDFLTENTYYREIYRVRPGHCLTVEMGGQVKQNRYWDIDRNKELNLKNDEEYAEAYYYYFSKAVKGISRSIKPVTVMTSGGMDSSSIVGMMSELKSNGHSINSAMLSIIYDSDHPANEKHYIDKLSALGIESLFIDGMQYSPLSTMEFDLRYQEEPARYANMPSWIESFKRIKGRGGNVAVIGQNADALFTIQPAIFISLFRKLNFYQIFRHIWDYPKGRRDFMAKEACLQIARMFIPTYYRSIYRMRKINQSLSPAFISSYAVDRNYFKWGVPDYGFDDPIRALQYNLITDYSFQIRDGYSRAPSVGGVEVRDPYLNREFVEFMFSIPAEQMLNKGVAKYIMRNAMKDIIPNQVRTRKTITTFDWLIRQGLTRWLQNNPQYNNPDNWSTVQHGYIQPLFLAKRLSTFNEHNLNKFKNKISLSSAAETLRMTNILLLENWLRSLT